MAALLLAGLAAGCEDTEARRQFDADLKRVENEKKELARQLDKAEQEAADERQKTARLTQQLLDEREQNRKDRQAREESAARLATVEHERDTLRYELTSLRDNKIGPLEAQVASLRKVIADLTGQPPPPTTQPDLFQAVEPGAPKPPTTQPDR